MVGNRVRVKTKGRGVAHGGARAPSLSTANLSSGQRGHAVLALCSTLITQTLSLAMITARPDLLRRLSHLSILSYRSACTRLKHGVSHPWVPDYACAPGLCADARRIAALTFALALAAAMLADCDSQYDSKYALSLILFVGFGLTGTAAATSPTSARAPGSALSSVRAPPLRIRAPAHAPRSRHRIMPHLRHRARAPPPGRAHAAGLPCAGHPRASRGARPHWHRVEPARLRRARAPAHGVLQRIRARVHGAGASVAPSACWTVPLTALRAACRSAARARGAVLGAAQARRKSA
jgi:hypothetical protein